MIIDSSVHAQLLDVDRELECVYSGADRKDTEPDLGRPDEEHAEPRYA